MDPMAAKDRSREIDPSAPPAEPGPSSGSPWILRALFAGAVLLYAGSLFNQGFQVGDEGVALVDAWRVASGQVPHRDFFEIVPPGSFLPTAFLFWMFGPSVVAARSLAALYAVLLGWLVDGISCSLGARSATRAWILAFLVPFGVWYWPIPSHHWVATLCQLAAVLCLLKAAKDERGQALWAGLAGAASAYACFTLQDQGGYFLGLLGALFFPFLAAPLRRRRLLAAWATGGGTVAAAFALYLLPRVSPSVLWAQWVSFPASRYREIAGNRGGLLLGWEVVRSSLESGVFSKAPIYFISHVAAGLVLTALPFAACAALFLAYRRRWLPPGQAGLLSAAAGAALLCTVHRWALTNLVWAAPLLLPSVALAGGRAERAAGRWIRPAFQWGASCLAILWLLNAISFAYLCRPSQTLAVSGPAGTLRSHERIEAQALQETIAAIDRLVPRGGPLFCEGYTPLISFLSLRPNPTKFTILIYPTYNTEDQLGEVVASLRDRPDARVLLMLPLRLGDPLHRFVAENYRPVWRTAYAALFESPGAAGKDSPIEFGTRPTFRER